jgi:hypothetical protein
MVAPVVVAAGIGAAGSLLGGIFGGKGAKKAAKAEVKMQEKALALQKQMYEQSRADLAPWRDAGGQAIGQGLAMLQPGYDYKTSPGYDFRFDEGQRAVESSAASKGMLMSGGTLKDLARFGDGLASADYHDSFNRMMAVAGGGQQAVNTGVNAAQNYANAGSNAFTNMGAAKASGYAGQNQAMQGTLANLINIAQTPGLFGTGGG